MAAVALAGVATLRARIALLGLARFAGLVALLGLARLALGLARLAALLLRHRDTAVDRVARIATRKGLAALLGRLAALLGRLAALLRLGHVTVTVIMTVGFYDIVFAMGHLYIVLSYRKSWSRVVDLSPEIKEKNKRT